ncbi:hypothetical protein DH2020_006194 [Rehmannia glutinosa]|uniref:UV-stimulated scaffold protein A-like protein n=1 Tax=Rehmannia glutinosa TaxID=99300 RepID=A0ABR0XI53_REHGL
MEEEREKVVVVTLIEKAVDSTAAEVDPRLLKAIKLTVRYLALLIMDELFMRSKLFRKLLVENLDQLLSLSIGFRRNHPLPAPASVASVLRSKAIEFLEKWNESFGIHYRQLRLGYDYLKNTLRFQFPNLQANAARIQQERREREMKTKEILLKKFESLKANFSSLKEEIHSKIDEIDECLEILRTKDDEDMSLVPMDDGEMEEFRNSELRQIRLDSLREGEKVHENSENKVVFDALREFYKVLVTKHLAAIQEWFSVLIRVEASDNSDTPTASTSSSTRDAEDVNNSIDGYKKKNHQSSKSNSDPLRSKLLNEAPVLNYGSFLDNWGSKRDVLANHRGLDLGGHWGRVDYDAVIPAEKIAELNPEELTPDMDSDAVDQLLKQAVKNIRERDKEEAKKRELDKQALKRAKLAKVRQHNEAVLRDAAIAATSRSSHIGEDMEMGNGSRCSSRSNKQTLASMLKKKETSKDRLAQRLLNSRARDATIRQMTVAEEANYREAFPNQW